MNTYLIILTKKALKHKERARPGVGYALQFDEDIRGHSKKCKFFKLKTLIQKLHTCGCGVIRIAFGIIYPCDCSGGTIVLQLPFYNTQNQED